MPNYICATCGAQYAESEQPPVRCIICEDERQYVGDGGQRWTDLAALRSAHRNVFEELEPGLLSIGIAPAFAIGQRALLVQTAHGNVLWDCLPLLDEPAVGRIRQLGGIAAIAVSHPHFYSGVVDWSRAFGGPKVYLHAGDRAWVTRPDPAITYWDGERCELLPGLTLVNCGGHFDGSSVLHWAGGADGRGALLAGDTLYVVRDRRHVTFMRSFPNYIPLNAQAVTRIVVRLAGFEYERIYSAFGNVVTRDAKAAVARSAERYLRAIAP